MADHFVVLLLLYLSTRNVEFVTTSVSISQSVNVSYSVVFSMVLVSFNLFLLHLYHLHVVTLKCHFM